MIYFIHNATGITTKRMTITTNSFNKFNDYYLFYHLAKTVSGQLPPRKIAPWLGLGFRLG